MRRAVVVALLLLSSCSKYERQDVSTKPASSASAAAAAGDADVDADIPASSWSTKSNDELELAGTPGRTAMLVYAREYKVRRGGTATVLPHEWFGVGPPRHDLSISADGNTLAVPVLEPPPEEAVAVILYDTRARRFAGRFAIPKKDVPDAGAATGKVSGDGSSVVWTFAGRPCMVTDVASGKLDVDGAKHAKCK